MVHSRLKNAVLEEVAASCLLRKGINGDALRRNGKQVGMVTKTDQGAWA